jgi:uncharacterized protein YlxW (UPF0749 family)
MTEKNRAGRRNPDRNSKSRLLMTKEDRINTEYNYKPGIEPYSENYWLENRKSEDIPLYNKKTQSEEIRLHKSKSKSVWQWSIIVACFILGIIVALLLKTYRTEGDINTIYGQRKELAEMNKYLQTERTKLEADLAKARETIEEFEEAASKGIDESSTLRKQLINARQEAGFVDLKGPGIIVELNDSPLKPKDGENPNFYIVHDIDLQALVNELWASGAEAIAVNDQRIVVNTAIRCAGPTITVNAVRLVPPYIVRAIGPPDNLETGLRYPGGFMDTMSPNIDRGVRIKVSQRNDILIPAFKGSLVHTYGRPVRAGGKEEK